MDQERFILYLKEMAKKYSVADISTVRFETGKIILSCNKGEFSFVYHYPLSADSVENTVPLLHWRKKRKYVELKNLLKNRMIETPVAMRIHHVIPKGEFQDSLRSLLIYEADLAEWMLGQSVDRIFADFSGDKYTNCILSMDGYIKVSMELGFSPNGSEPILLHEIIARTGIASDMAADTQTQQYPIYVFKGEKTERYTDIDNELYDLDNTQADCIRFILDILADPVQISGLLKQAEHLERIFQAAERAGRNLEYVEI